MVDIGEGTELLILSVINLIFQLRLYLLSMIQIDLQILRYFFMKMEKNVIFFHLLELKLVIRYLVEKMLR